MKRLLIPTILLGFLVAATTASAAKSPEFIETQSLPTIDLDEITSADEAEPFALNGQVYEINSTTGGSSSDNDQVVYSLLKDQIEQVAAGTLDSAVFTVNLSDFGLSTDEIPESEFGLSGVFYWDEATQKYLRDDEKYNTAISTMRSWLEVDSSLIFHRLHSDLPYDLYWAGGSMTPGQCPIGYAYSSYPDTHETSTVFYFTGNDTFAEGLAYTYSFNVDTPYLGSSSDPYSVDTTKTAAASTVTNTTRGIVEAASGMEDYEKLVYYKEQICQLTSYNDAALEAGNAANYGSRCPWNVIWVFDGDTSTNVVCEGYAKAFKYLCDLTEFDSDIKCYTVSGDMDGGTGAGAHMWNVVRMPDGQNYLVDVTNCDEGTIGYPDLLFMAGMNSGNVSSYTVEGVSYTYDDETLALYTSDELTLASSDYEPGNDPRVASGSCGDNLSWSLYDTGELVISGYGDMWDFTDFTSTPWNAYRNQVTSLVLPDEITSIGDYAFRNMDSMTGINSLPDSVSRIGYEAFCNTGIEGTFYISANVCEIGRDAFGMCNNLVAIEVDSQNYSYCSMDGYLCSWDNTVILQCPQGKTGKIWIPYDVLTIGKGAYASENAMMIGSAEEIFVGKNVSDIEEFAFWRAYGLSGRLVLPKTLTHISRASFAHNYSLTSVVIPSSIEEIYGAAFAGCSNMEYALFRGTAPVLNTFEPVFDGCADNFVIYCLEENAESFYNDPNYNAEADTWYGYPLVVKERDYTIVNSGDCGDELTWTLYNDGILEITGTGAMWDYSYSYDAQEHSHNYITTAPWGAYKSELTGLILNEGITYIGACAFEGCYGFVGDLIIPESVAEIGMSAFEECDGFDGALSLPAELQILGERAFYCCTGLEGNLNIPTGLTVIPYCAFTECRKMTGDLIIPGNVGSVGEAAFTGCVGFEGELVLPESLTVIGNFAFEHCSSLSGELVLPEGVQSIGRGAFHGDGNLEGTLIIPGSVNEIGQWAFDECYGLSDVVFEGSAPETVGNRPFGTRTNAFTVECYEEFADSFTNNENYNETAETWYGYTFQVIYNQAVVIASGSCGDNLTWELYETGELVFTGSGAMTDYNNTLPSYSSSNRAPWREYTVTAISLPEGMTTIGSYAFYGCDALTGDLVIPEGVEEIHSYAFYGCRGLDGELSLPSTLTSIASQAFHYCENLKGDLIIPEGVTSVGSWAFVSTGFDGTISLPSTLTTVGERAFGSISNLHGDLVIPESLTDIGEYAFAQDGNLTGTLTLPEGLIRIRSSAFYMTGFSGTLTIPAGVTFIGHHAFAETGYDEVIFEGPAPETVENVVFGEDSVTVYCYPENADSFYEGLVDGLWYGYNFEVIGGGSGIVFDGGLKLNAKSLSLSGDIGVNFKMTVPEEYVNDSYMTFTVHGRTQTIQTSSMTPNDAGQYVFTCYVTSIEMAEEIQAVFTYGTYTASMTYSVADYVVAYEEVSGSYAQEITDLVHALADYGHHAQVFLSSYRDWTIGNQYAEMSGYNNTYSTSVVNETQTALQNYALNYTTNSDISAVNISLNLESQTSIYVYVTPTSGYTGSLTCTEGYAIEQVGNRYRVVIPNIMAHQLGEMYTLHLTTSSGTSTVTVSALSYANSILTNTSMNTVAANKYFAVALYKYYQAATALN